LLLSQKNKQLTNQLQFDYSSSLTMNRRDKPFTVVTSKVKQNTPAGIIPTCHQ